MAFVSPKEDDPNFQEVQIYQNDTAAFVIIIVFVHYFISYIFLFFFFFPEIKTKIETTKAAIHKMESDWKEKPDAKEKRYY